MENIIKIYIENLKIEEFENILKTHDINANKNDLNTLFFYLKTRWHEVYNKDINNIAKELEVKLDPDLFIKLKLFYLEYKNKI